MNAVFRWLRRLTFYIRRPRLDGELNEEMRFHLDMREADFVAGGLSPEDARAAARRRFGNPALVHEDSRAFWSIAPIDALTQDLRYAWRMLIKKPGFTGAVILVLALGIGANTAVFTVLNAVLFEWAAAFPESDRLAMVWQSRDDQLWAPTPADFRDWRAGVASFDRIGAYTYRHATLTGNGEPERLAAVPSSPELFDVLGVEPMHGRAFAADEETWGRHRVALLGYALWQRRFGGDAKVVGRTIILDGEPHVVVGVLPPGAWFTGTPADIWVPLAFAPDDQSNDRNSHFLYAVGRLRRGTSIETAGAEMKSVARQLELTHAANRGLSASVVPLRAAVLGDIEQTFLILAGAVALVLLIACANIANLLLVRGATRRREIALRTTLGAGRGRIVRQLLTENMLLSLAGGILGLIVARVGVDAATRLLPAQLPRLAEAGVAIDGRVLAFTVGLSVLTGIVFGLAPAVQALRLEPLVWLKEGGRGGGAGRRERRLRQILAVAELALATVLLIGAGLLVKSMGELQKVDLGVRAHGLLIVQVPLAEPVADEPARVAAVLPDLVSRVSALPGVKSADMSSHVPLGGGGQAKYFTVEGRRPASTLDELPIVSARQEGPRSLDALGVRLLRGRLLDSRDSTGTQRVVLVNDALARQFFPGEDPIGKRITLDPPEAIAPPGYLPDSGRFTRYNVVGVVGDVRYRTLDSRPEPVVYIPYLQREENDQLGWAPEYLVVHSEIDPAALVPAIREQVRAVLPSQAIASVKTIEEMTGLALQHSRFSMLLLGTFAALALVLAAVGVYAVVAYSVSQRTHEIGVRMALGANRSGVAGMVLKESLLIDALGLGSGLAAAFGLSRAMRGLLYGVAPTDPFIFASVAALLFVVAVAASYLPAWRAAQIAPVLALKAE